MRHLLPMFIVPRGFAQANSYQGPIRDQQTGELITPEVLGYFKGGWEAPHLHSQPFANDATHELLTCEFLTPELEAAFRALPEVQEIPDVLETSATVADGDTRHAAKLASLATKGKGAAKPAQAQKAIAQHLAGVQGSGVVATDNAFTMRKKIRATLQLGF